MSYVAKQQLFILAIASVTVALMTRQYGVMEKFGLVGEAVSAVLATTSQPHCSVLIISDGKFSASALYQKLTRLEGWHGISIFEVVTAGHDANLTHQHLSHVVTQARVVRRRMWCVAVVAASTNTHFLATLAKESLRGRLLVWETRLVVVTQLARPLVEDLLHHHWTLAMMNAVVLNLEDDLNHSRWIVYQHQPYTPEGPSVVKAAFWTPESGLHSTSDLFHSKFMKAAFPITTFVPSFPIFGVVYGQTPDGNLSTKYVGRDYVMLMAVAQALNFTPNVILSRTFTKAVMLVARRTALLLTSRMVMMPQILSQVDYTLPIDRASLTFSLAKPMPRPQWQSLYYPFQPVVWTAVIALSLILPLVFILVAHLNGSVNSENGTGERTVRVLLAQDLGSLPRVAPARLLLLGWMIFAFLVGVSYRSKLTAFLTVRKYPARPETLEQLSLTNIPSIFPTPIKWHREFFTTSLAAAMRNVGQRAILVPDRKTGMSAMAANIGAFFYERNMMRLAIADNYTRENGDTDVYVAKEDVLPTHAAWYVPHDAPYKLILDRVLARIIEAGLKDKWMEDVIKEATMEYRAKRKQQQITSQNTDNVTSSDIQSPTHLQSITLTHLQGPFWVLVLGLLAAFVSFLAETLMRKCVFQAHHDA